MEAFAEKVRKAVVEILGEDYEVKIHEVCKNNNVTLHGLVILAKEENISPTIYLNPFWEAYKQGATFSTILQKLMEIYHQGMPKERVDMSFFSNFELVKDRICFRLISAKRNQELLEKIPHTYYLDLAICFFYSYEDDNLGRGSILIYNTHLETWGQDKEALWKLAIENTPKLYPSRCDNMEDVLLKMLKENSEEKSSTEELIENEQIEDEQIRNEQIQEDLNAMRPGAIDMKIVSNAVGNYGAACILYPGFLKEISQRENSNFYLIPSSIHEMILLPQEGTDPEHLKYMVKEVNTTQVEPEEVLSDHVYFYDGSIDKTIVVA